jgi:3-hydroxypropanoate dehydrogenase
MSAISNEDLKILFTEARTAQAWLPQEVSDQTLRDIYELMKWGPTSANASPGRIAFVKSGPAKEKLTESLSPMNVDKVKAAPVTAIIAFDEKFYDFIPQLLPIPNAAAYRDMFSSNKPLSEATTMRNSSLQGGYFILAARALGLDCGPMSGFDNQKLDKAFFSGTSWKSNFICNLGYGDPSKLRPRGPRLSFEQACLVV